MANTVDTLKNLDSKLLNLLNSAHILVGTSNEEIRAGSIKEKLSSRLKQLEENEYEHETDGNSTVVAESVMQEKPFNTAVREKFVEKCLELLGSLETTLINIIDIKENKKANEPELLGIRDMNLVHTMLEIVISWGIYPCLMTGVGIPISRRTRSRHFQQEFLNNPTNEEAEKRLSPQSRYIYLFKLMQSLIKIAYSPSLKQTMFTTVSSMIRTRHLTDIYSALLQLAYGPLPTSDKSDTHTENKLVIPDKSAIERQHGDFILMRKECINMFGRLFEREDPFRSLEALTMLLGSPLHPAPKWLKNVCGRFLTQILLRPNGVKSVMNFMIGGESEVGLTQFETISKLILSVPAQAKSSEDYFSIICPQLLNILQSTSTLPSLQIPNINNITLPIVKVAAFTIIRMADKFPVITKKFIIANIFSTLWKWWGLTPDDNQSFQHYDSSTDLDPLIMDEQSLQLTIATIHHILVGSEPIPGLLQMFLEDSVVPLYYLYSFTCSSKSFLKNIVSDILLAYFGILNINEGVEGLKEILLRKTKKRIAPNAGDVGEIYFAPGTAGGVVMRLRMVALNFSNIETSIDVNTFVDFLKRISNNELAGDFFMYILNEYTSLQSLQLHEQNSRYFLTLLQLILSMIENLGSVILQKPGQIIAFVNNVLERYHQKISRVKQETNVNKSIFGELDNIVKDIDEEELMEDENEDDEILSLALTLLTSLLAEHKVLSAKDFSLLTLIKNNLSLQNHHSPSIRSLSRNLQLTISAREASSQTSNADKSNEQIRRQEGYKKFQEAMEALQDDILPIKARGLVILKEMVLEKDIIMEEGENLNKVLDIFVNMVQDEESFIYFNAVKGLSALTDIHGEKIMKKLTAIYVDGSQNLDNRLRIGEAILQTIQRCGDVLGKYITALLPPLLFVLNREHNQTLKVSALSIIGCACETSPLALSTWFRDVIDWVLNILDIQKEVEIRRASIVLLLSLFRGISSHSQTIFIIPKDLLERIWRTLKYIEETDKDELIRYYARIGISDLDATSHEELFGSVLPNV
ncbi:7348_t:CDS:10 [Gigaspora margarita]|uniref:7348_t:CDS:1 n=1 Tax=Gigaspora margarita TaxID=4874 RepID=A0ABN7V293_GIGMA|nr:7348_t:CDS:10 [Gigaspora margarita]